MEDIRRFVEELAQLEPVDRLGRLRGCPDQDIPVIREELAWWHARYRFTDKREKRTMDRFVWLYLCCANETYKDRELAAAYDDALLSEEVEAALAVADSLYPRLLDAGVLYIRTVDTRRSVFGLYLTGKPNEAEVKKRLAAHVAGRILPGLYRGGWQKPRLDAAVSAIVAAAKEVYPGIQPLLLEAVEQYPDRAFAAFVTDCLRPEGF